MTMRMYANRKAIPIEALVVDVIHSKSHAKDSEDAASGSAKVDVFRRSIAIKGPLSEEQLARLLDIADRCPVHRTLESQARIETQYSDNS